MIRSESSLVQSGFCNGVASVLGLSTEVVSAVVAGVERSMRVASREDEARVVVVLSAELEYCARTYCGAPKTDEGVFDELVDFVLTRFGHLGVSEIREAFSLAAAGELGNVDMNSYHGMFTVLMLGNLLKAYNEYRVAIVKEVRRREILLLAAEREAERQVNWNTAAWKADRRETLLALQDPTAEYVTAYDHDFLLASGDLAYTEAEKRAAWEEARGLVKEDYEALALTSRSFRLALDDVRAGRKNEGFEARQIAMAKRLLVLGWIRKNRETE